jgi:hypothetical protein
MTSRDQQDFKALRDPYGYIKTKKFKIDNIHCERVFLYIFGDPGP